MSIDQFDFWIAFFEENYAIQYILAIFKVAGIISWPDPTLKLVMIVAGITSEKNLFIDTVDEEDHMPCAVPTRRDRPERTIPKEIHSFAQGWQINALGEIDFMQFIDTGQMITLHEEFEIYITFTLTQNIRNVLRQIDDPSRMILMQVGEANAF